MGGFGEVWRIAGEGDRRDMWEYVQRPTFQCKDFRVTQLVPSIITPFSSAVLPPIPL